MTPRRRHRSGPRMVRGRGGRALAGGVVLGLLPWAALGSVPPDRPAGGREYLVRFAAGVEAPAGAAALAGEGAQVLRTFGAVLEGALVRVPERAAAALRSNPMVAGVAPDGPVSAAGTQIAAPWGLDRSDQRQLPLSGTYTYGNAGSGVTAYIVDSGIRAGHEDFGGRVRSGFTAIDDGFGTADCAGHGTHVAGTVGGATYGMAKDVALVAVRVLGCDASGAVSGVLAGLDWVMADHAAGTPAVVNMSFGGDVSAWVDDAVAALVADGVTVVTSAGNGGQDACLQSPSRAPAAITVAATDASDSSLDGSNWGPCVDLFAPGATITSDWYTSDSAAVTLSGTSMSAAHVTGAAALVLGERPSLGPAQVALEMVEVATPDVVTDTGPGSPNRLLYSPAPGVANDDFEAAAPFALSGPSPLTGSTVGATREPGEPNHAGGSGSASVWWTFTAPRAGAVTLATSGSTFDTLLGVYSGPAVDALTEVASNDDAAGGVSWSQVDVPVLGGSTYRIAVDGRVGGSGSVVLAFTWAPELGPPGAGNRAPVSADDAYQVDSGRTLAVPPAIGVLANDTDPDGDALSATLVAAPSHGSLTLAADGSLTYTPAPGWVGVDEFGYRAEDGRGGADGATVAISTMGVAGLTVSRGYWLTASDGGIFAFGAADFLGSAGGSLLNRPTAGMTATPSGKGYWLVASDGGIFAFGDAGFFGSTGAMLLNRPIVGMAATPSGKGYWLVASDGGIFAFGDARFFGSTGGLVLSRPIVGMAPSPTGRGYWLVASDGGIFAFGDARFFGSAGAMLLNRPIVGMAATPTGNGYWFVASDGGIFAFGGARYFGSAGGFTLSRPVVGMAPTASGLGYWFVASDGGIFAFGDAGFLGSTGGFPLSRPVVGIAARP